MTAASSTSQDQFHKLISELVTVLQKAQEEQTVNQQIHQQTSDVVVHICSQLIMMYNSRIDELLQEGHKYSQDVYEKEWCALTWPLLSILNRMMSRPLVSNELHVMTQFNQSLVRLVNKCRVCTAPKGLDTNKEQWDSFWEFHHQTLTVLHELYSEIDTSSMFLEKSIQDFQACELSAYLQAFTDICEGNHDRVLRRQRLSQVDRMMHVTEIDEEAIHLSSVYYINILFILGNLAARIQGLRWETINYKIAFSRPDPVSVPMRIVFQVVERLISDALLSTKPNVSPILVTNNLYPFNCASLAPGMIFKQFDVQIVSEETAMSIQAHMINIRRGFISQTLPNSFSSAALLALKPTCGVKRNNATASAGKGGNTAHKKSDVNSKETVKISPEWNDVYGCWQANYPHLLCTTRQKDAVLLDTRMSNTGKRPLFYFYIRGMLYGPSGDYCYVRTLSLPFTIATRRNQDCQVQRMMSSYTATCFWLYGLRSTDGLILNWCAKGVEWSRFKKLYRSYFMVNADVKRPLSDSDFRLLEEKLECDDCRGGSPTSIHDAEKERLVSFKNVLCPHLKYDMDNHQMRFSIWRGLLEVLQIYQDSRTNVRTLWNDYVLLGFNDFAVIEEVLLPHLSVMCLRLSYVIGGAVCISLRTSQGVIVHLEPIDLKKLQAKSIFEYISDVAESSKIDYVYTARNELIPVRDLVSKYKIGMDNDKVRTVYTNITHGGPVDCLTETRFSPLRIAVVTCLPDDVISPPTQTVPVPQEMSLEMIPPPPMSYQHNQPMDQMVLLRQNYIGQPSDSNFDAELAKLMKRFQKTSTDVFHSLGYTTMDNPTAPYEYLSDISFFQS